MDFKKASAYIESLYEKRKLTQKQYIEATELKDFGTVVDDDVARMLQVLITLVRPRKILEIGTSVGFSTVSMAKVIKQYGGKIKRFDKLMNIQFKGVYFFTQQALAYMNDGGGIINISSRLAQSCMPGYSAYAAMKGAIETLTKYQAKELGYRGIKVNSVAPGPIATDFAGGILRDNISYNEKIKTITALGRVGEPEDIGGVIAFLCTDNARWITAQRIEVSGGTGL